MSARKRRPTAKDLLPLLKPSALVAGEPTGEAFRHEWIDFDRGIRVGNLEPHERITRILKYRLEQRYGTSFVTDRWGRGVYWQWICWLPRADRDAKPLSHDVNFGCAKLFISIDRDERIFQCGLQVERGYARAPSAYPGCLLRSDWDWNRLMKQCAKGTALDEELRRLLGREGFIAALAGGDRSLVLNEATYRSAAQIRREAGRLPAGDWAGFQLYYPMSAREVRSCGGRELVDAICAAFDEVVPSMNLCLQVSLEAVEPPLALRGRNAPRTRPS